MFRPALLLALSASVLAPALLAQTPTPAPAPVCLPPASLEQLPAALDDAISGPADKDRTCLRQLVASDVRMMLIVSKGTTRSMTLDDWIDAMQRRGSTPIFERQVKVKSETYGLIAHLWNTYEIRATPDGKATSRGINSIQAIFDGQRWRVVAILWQAESAETPIPEKYLP